MPKLRVNLSEIPEGGGQFFTGHQPGRYRGKLVGCKEQDSSKGNPMLVWEWELVEGPDTGQTIASFTTLLDNALFGLRDHLVALGAPPDLDAELDTDALLGREVVIQIGSRKSRRRDNGEEETTSTVISVSAVSGGNGATAAAPAAARRPAARAKSASDLPF